MKEYLERLDAHLGNIKAAAEAEGNPQRARFLWNYLHHGAFELSGEWERIFTPEMTIDEPQYEMRTGTEDTLVLDGEEDVRHFYAAMESENLMAIDDGRHQLFTNDDGLAEFAATVDFPTGREILEEGTDHWYYRGVEIDDPDATYARLSPHAMFWPYTPEGQLIGEMVYQIGPFEVSKIDPDAVPTLDEVADLASEYYPENVDGDTPYADLDV